MIDSNDVKEAVKAIAAAGLGSVDLSTVLQKYSEPPLTQIPRYLPLRSATELAVRFALEKPGSLIAVCGRTAVSTKMLLFGRGGLAHVLSERSLDDIKRQARFEIGFSNGSRIIGIPSTTRPERVRGYQINLLLYEFGIGQRFFDGLLRCIRPLPGIENCIIAITDDEADE